MLVKLGDVWVDPAEVIKIRPKDISPEGSQIVEIAMRDKIDFHVHGVSHDDCAAIVNESLTPKQSWSEDVSEPDKT